MTVREFMSLWVDDVDMVVYQTPIKEIDKNTSLVRRQSGSVDVLINSNQNYLDFEIVNLQDDDGRIVITCKANKEQTRKTMEAYKTENSLNSRNGRKENTMKFAEKLAAMSDDQATKEEAVINEIVNFFAEKFASGEMMNALEKNLREKEICLRKKNITLEFWRYTPGCSETYFGLLGKKWSPEDDHGYEHKGVNLVNIYKNVLLAIAELARENFEKEGFEVRLLPDNTNKRYNTYIVEISW